MATEEVIGVLMKVKTRRQDWTVSEFRSEDGKFFTALGDSPEGEFINRQPYRLRGRWINDPKWGRQFKFSSVTPEKPTSRESVIAFLQQCPGIGPALAVKIHKTYGVDSIDVLKNEPDRVAEEVEGINGERSVKLARYLSDRADTTKTQVELIGLFHKHGFPKKLHEDCIKTWGSRSIATIDPREGGNPYLLQRFRRVGFLRCDSLYLALGGDRNSIMRQAYCIAFAAAKDTDGNCWIPLDDGFRTLREKVSGTEVKEREALQYAIDEGVLAYREDHSGKEWIGDPRRTRAESTVARLVGEKLLHPSIAGTIDDERLTPHQREKIDIATSLSIGIFGGGPGTGKTFTTAALVKQLTSGSNPLRVLIVAPTGKAAVRCTEAMCQAGIDIQARTIHSALRAKGVSASTGDWEFDFGEGKKLPYDIVIVDEASMLDVQLFSHLLQSVTPATNIILVGDVDQLPPVQPGAPLRDLIEAGIPYGELSVDETHRNAGQIVRACEQIKRGESFEFCELDEVDLSAGKNLVYVPCRPEEAASKIVEIIRQDSEDWPDSMPDEEYDLIWSNQVVSAVNRKSEMSRTVLNPRLQDALNASPERTKYRTGDKIVNLENRSLRRVSHIDGRIVTKMGEDEEYLISNGDFGRVVFVEEKRLAVEFATPYRFVVVPVGKQDEQPDDDEDDRSDRDDAKVGKPQDQERKPGGIDLGYSATCHKMQGSSAPIVFVTLDPHPGAAGRFGICDRSWLRTAISRAEVICYLVGDINTADRMIAKNFIHKRKTFLVDELLQTCVKLGVPVGRAGYWMEQGKTPFGNLFAEF